MQTVVATVCKQFTFDSAHQLPGHKGKCANLHGHTYKLEIFLRDLLVTEAGSSDEGFVADFGDISSWYKRELEPNLDHRFLNDMLWLDRGYPTWGPAVTAKEWGVTQEEATGLMIGHGYQEMRTTAENMCAWLFQYIRSRAPFGDKMMAIRLWETPTGYAEVDINSFPPEEPEIDAHGDVV